MSRYFFPIFWQLSDLHLTWVHSIKMASASQWQGTFDIENSLILAYKGHPTESYKLEQITPVGIVSYSSSEMSQETKNILNREFIKKAGKIKAFIDIDKVACYTDFAKECSFMNSEELMKLAQNKNILNSVQNIMPRWSVNFITSFLFWWGASSGQSYAQIANEVEKNPTAVLQKAQEFENLNQNKSPEQKQTTQPAQPDYFSSALSSTLKFEGGYVNDPKDTGGETNFGITRKTYTDWLKNNGMPIDNIDMHNIPIEHINAIYKQNYWNKSGCEQLPPVVAQQVFDFSVNSGNKNSVSILQSIVGAKADGNYGPQTNQAVQNYIKQNGELNLAKSIVDARRNFILKKIQEGKINSKFKKGLLNRVNAIEKMIPIPKKASSDFYQDDWVEHIFDVDRYTTDRYDLFLSAQETNDGFSIGFQVNSGQLGVTSCSEYWHFKPEESKVAKKAFADIKRVASQIRDEIEKEKLIFSLILPRYKNALKDIYPGYKEKTGNLIINNSMLIKQEIDWRNSLYGNRYPNKQNGVIKDDFNAVNINNEKTKQIEYPEHQSRSSILKYKYAQIMPKLISSHGLNWGKISSFLKEQGHNSVDIAEINNEFLQYSFHLS